jgi:antitoxin component of RelBE/YafQ-DinJ toxin-antitoxin module
MNDKQILVKLPAAVKKLAEKKAKALGLSVSAYVRMLIIKG